MVAIGWIWKSIDVENDNAQKLVEDYVKFAHEIALWSIFVIFMIFPVFLIIFDKVELFGIRSQLFEYSNSIRFLKSNEYEYE